MEDQDSSSWWQNPLLMGVWLKGFTAKLFSYPKYDIHEIQSDWNPNPLVVYLHVRKDRAGSHTGTVIICKNMGLENTMTRVFKWETLDRHLYGCLPGDATHIWKTDVSYGIMQWDVLFYLVLLSTEDSFFLCVKFPPKYHVLLNNTWYLEISHCYLLKIDS